jgi:hypothetical protein
MLSAAPLTFHVVDDASANRDFRYAANGAAQGSTALVSANAAPRGVASMVGVEKTWVIDANRNVYVYNATSGALVGNWSAGSMANNATPEGIATDGTDIWIVDSKSDKVFRYAGAASRTSGSQTAASSFPLSNGSAKDMVTDGYSLWIVDDTAKTDRVYKYNLDGGWLVGSWTVDSANKAPTGITLDPANIGDIWISDGGTDRVYKYAAAASRDSGSQSSASSFALATGNGNAQGLVVPGRPWAETPYQVEWIRQFGSADNDWGRGVTVDPFDNIYVSGVFASPQPLDGGSSSAGSGGALFVTRLDAAGNTIWFQQPSPTPGVYYDGVQVAADALGNIFQIVEDGVDATGNSVAPQSLRNYSPDGVLKWTFELPGEGLFDVAVDNLGYAYFPTYEGNSVHLRKVDSTGALAWHTTIDTGGICNSSGVSLDQDGNIYVAAITEGSALGANAGGGDSVVMKFNNNGVMQWARQFGTAMADSAFYVAADRFGNVYTGGRTDGSLAGPNAGPPDVFLAKHDGAGNLLWMRQWGTSGVDTRAQMWVDSQGSVYRAIATAGSLGGAHIGGQDIAVAKLDSNGDLVWATQVGTSGTDNTAGGIWGDAQGNLYVSGYTTGSLGGPSAGNQDAFVIKLSPPVAMASSSALEPLSANAAVSTITANAGLETGAATTRSSRPPLGRFNPGRSGNLATDEVSTLNLNLLNVATPAASAAIVDTIHAASNVETNDIQALDSAFAAFNL